jgi:hypothetical protein
VRNPTLHAELEAFTIDVGEPLRRAAAEGDGIPFEVTETGTRGAGGAPFRCYRPLTGAFIRGQHALLAELPGYESASQTLDGVGGLELYLRTRGEHLGARLEANPAQVVLLEFLARVYGETTEFSVDQARFGLAYAELERAIYEGRCVTEVIAPLFGIDLDPDARELTLGEGLAIVRSRALVGAPPELAENPLQPLLVLRVAHDRAQQPSASFARQQFERVLTALRLYERGAYAIGPIGHTRIDDGVWTPIAVGSVGRRNRLTLIPRDEEEELRSFCNVIGRRLVRGFGGAPSDNSGAGEVAWALSRFEMGCQRVSALEALTDHLLALRALLEPEGPTSGRLTQRLAVICAPPPQRAALAERIAAAVALERSVVAGIATHPAQSDLLADEVAEHLRAILRDVLCGHLDVDLCGVADDLLAESAEADSIAA